MLTVESFALSTNLRINKPDIQLEFVPTDFDLEKTIIVYSGLEKLNQLSHCYDLWNDVIDFARPELAKHGYTTLQIGGAQDGMIKADKHLLGLSIHQSAYLISNCALVLTTDSSYAHLAGIFDRKLVALYGPTPPYSNGPAFGYKGIQKLLRSNKDKPSFAPQEFPKTINENKPEDVVKEIFELLHIESDIPQTVYQGKLYPTTLIEIIPNSPLSPSNFLPPQSLTVRMDVYFNEEILCNILSGRNCNIITDKPIDLKIIKSFKKNISNINIKVDNIDIGYLRNLKNTGVKITFFSERSGDDLTRIRFDLLDIGLVEHLVKNTKPVDFNPKNIGNTRLKFKSNKFILSRREIYLSHFHEKNDIKINSFGENYSDFTDDPEFWVDSDLFYIYSF